MNPYFPYSELYEDKQWRTHICFESCRPDPQRSQETDAGFEVDERPICQEGDDGTTESILCLNPYENECQVLELKSQTCFDTKSLLCIDWSLVLIAIFVGNFVQTLFQASLASTLEMTFYPTDLDIMQDPELMDQR